MLEWVKASIDGEVERPPYVYMPPFVRNIIISELLESVQQGKEKRRRNRFEGSFPTRYGFPALNRDTLQGGGQYASFVEVLTFHPHVKKLEKAEEVDVATPP
mmetsp:Transcript_44102/g.107776  ORF Transcript_44102/g.107776 Transcript_44102/m.107776 type:complete len:102 (+) Transcript_44102:223-528(+)